MNHTIFALAGLLHDIGKFAQRADDKGYKDSKYLSEPTKQLAGKLCNATNNGSFTHQDALWTYEFITKHKGKFINAGLWDYGMYNLADIAACHHKPANSGEGVVTLADYWSSGTDGATQSKPEPTPEPNGVLLSVFNKLSTETLKNGIAEKFGYPAIRYDFNETTFPKNAAFQDKPPYGEVWSQFENDFKLLPDGDANSFVYSLFHLLKIYAWYIPASAIDSPDSLFEHLKTTGAFAHCIANYINACPDAIIENNNRISIKENHYPALMVCGDISGIQNFIYNITNTNAIKSLKGRSFFIQLLTESIATEILDCCGATIINQVYAAGGKFYLLLPHTPEVARNLEDYKKKIQLKLWDTHKGKLTCIISSVAFTMKNHKNALMAFIKGSDAQAQAAHIGELWAKLAEKTTEEKRRKCALIVHEKYNELFTPQGMGGKVQFCAITSVELTDAEAATYKDDDNEDIIISKQAREQIELGQKVDNAQYLVQLAGNGSGFIPALHTVWDVGRNAGHVSEINKYINIGVASFPQIIPGLAMYKNTAIGFKIVGGIENPANEHGVMSLEELCKTAPLPKGSHTDKLGILRMDVDNLGNLFMNGFMEGDKNKASFSSLGTLSALLEHFFGGYVNVLRNREFKDHVNIVYSGGDDLFAAGRWDILLLFAIRIREKFKEFVCNRTDITLSAGIAIINPKFPVAKGAEIAAEMESIAKNNITPAGKKKDAITLFGIPLHWQDEMPFVREFKNDLSGWLKEDAINKGLLMKIFSYYELDKKNEPEWQWQCAYTIARYGKGADGKKKYALDQIKTLIFTKSYNKGKYKNVSFPAIIAACRWAELEFKQ